MIDSEEQALHFYKAAAFTILLRGNILGLLIQQSFSS